MKPLISLLFLFSFDFAKYDIEKDPRLHEDWLFLTIVYKICLAETGNNHYYRNGDIVTNFNGSAIGVMQVKPETLGYFNMKNNLNYPASSLSNEETNRFIGTWLLAFMLYEKNMTYYQAINAYNMGFNSRYCNPSYLLKVIGNTNFLIGKKAIGHKKIYNKYYPRFRNFP